MKKSKFTEAGMIKPEKIKILKNGLAEYNQEQEDECTIMSMDDYLRYSEEEEADFYNWLFDSPGNIGDFGKGMTKEQKHAYRQLRKELCASQEEHYAQNWDDDFLFFGLWHL